MIKNIGGEKEKMKTKTMLVIGVVLCSLFLVALPVVVAEDDFVLGVYGNANEDDTIDMRDLTYVKLIFFGEKPKTEFADAKCDGKIDPLDFVQIKLIIVGKEEELTVVDTLDRTVTIDKPLERIAILNRNIIEVMRSLNVEKEKIVAVSSDVPKREMYFPEFQDYPSIGSARSPDVEKILELDPDAVFIYATVMTDSWVQEQLEDAGVTVVRFDCFKPENYIEEAETLGYIFDKEEDAETFIGFYEDCMATVADKGTKIPEDERPKVYFERLYGSYKVGGEGTGYDTFVEMAGGNYIFSDLSGYVVVDPEEVVMRDPEIIVKQTYNRSDYGYDVDDTKGLEEVRAEMMGRPELENVDAVKNNEVYVIIKELTAGKHFIAIGYLAKWFHPDIFADLDPKAIHQEYLTRFQGLDFDLDEHGVFVYPEPS
ncbi:iron complex transport system substrate-binding protein [Methanophagales archaeon]|nr:iron complex transport system substrate-binding protein [Methanophagales archaeon]